MRPRGATRSLSDFTVLERLQIGTGWTWRRRWPTMAAFLADYASIREEYLGRYRHLRRPPFAELALRYRQAHGAAALAAATNQGPGDVSRPADHALSVHLSR